MQPILLLSSPFVANNLYTGMYNGQAAEIGLATCIEGDE